MSRDKCAIIGYGPDKLSFGYNEDCEEFDALNQELIKTVVGLCHNGYRKFYICPAAGVGILCAEIVLSLQSSYDDLKLVCAIPYLGWENKWSGELRVRYQHVIENCSKKVYISKSKTEASTEECNRYLVDSSDLIICVCDEADMSDEAGKAAAYAKVAGKRVEFIKPNTH